LLGRASSRIADARGHHRPYRQRSSPRKKGVVITHDDQDASKHHNEPEGDPLPLSLGDGQEGAIGPLASRLDRVNTVPQWQRGKSVGPNFQQGAYSRTSGSRGWFFRKRSRRSGGSIELICIFPQSNRGKPLQISLACVHRGHDAGGELELQRLAGLGLDLVVGRVEGRRH